MKGKKRVTSDELCAEYNLRTLLKGGVRGKYTAKYRAGANVVLLDPDVAKAFPTERAVNEALRLVLRLNKVARSERKTAKA